MVESLGICYTVLLLIPTEEGFKGGQIKVINKNDEILEFDFEKQSNKDFSILIFPAENRYQIDPVNDGSSFIVVFHLVWKDSLIANSANPSLFGAIELYQDLKNLLLPWKQLLTAGILSDKVTCQFGSAKNNVSHAADESMFTFKK